MYKIEEKEAELAASELIKQEGMTSEQAFENDEKIAKLKQEIEEEKEKAKSYAQQIIDLLNEAEKTQTEIFEEHTTLLEKIQIFIKKHGALSLTTFALTVSALIASIVGAVGRGASAAVVPSGGGGGGGGGGSGGDNFIVRHLKNLVKVLKTIAGKMLLALPGVIGAVVSFLLNSAAAVLSYFASNLGLLLIAGGVVAWKMLKK